MELLITKGKTVLFDEADAAIVLAHSWCAVEPDPGNCYPQTSIKGKMVYMHKVLTGWPATDHRNGNGLDNRRDNLRRCTTQQNNFNRRKHRKHTSRFKGVCFHKRIKKWQANIRLDYKLRHLGYFLEEEAAARAYDAAALELFGEFARLNFPIAHPLAT